MGNGDTRGPDRDAWLRTWYQLAHADVRWAKEQGWRVVNWGLLILGALVAVAKYASAQASPIVFSLIGAAVVIVAIAWLVDLHRFAEYGRRTCADTCKEIKWEVPGGVTTGAEHMIYLMIKIAVLVVALVLFAVLIVQLGHRGGQ